MMKVRIINNILIYVMLIFITSSCVSDKELESLNGAVVENELKTDSSETGSNTSSSSFPTNPKQVRIIATGIADGATIGAIVLNVGDTIDLRAALYDYNDNFLEDVNVNWSVVNSAGPTGSIAATGGAAEATTATYTATAPGTALIQVSYSGVDTDVITRIDTTGTIIINSLGTPGSMTTVSGDSQTAIVNNNIGAITILLKDTSHQPLQGETVVFTVVAGGGTLISVDPERVPTVVGHATTDASGNATVIYKLGNLTGTGNNVFKAELLSDASINVSMSANATADAPHHLKFTQIPTGTNYSATDFTVQPIIRVEDQFNNLIITSGTMTITELSCNAGACSSTFTNGALAFSDGVATYSHLQYGGIDSNIIMRASFIDGATYTGDSSTFDIAALPPGACQTNDAVFSTQDGGCKDLASGLVWSSRSVGNITWHAAVWGESGGGSISDINDFGRTNDYPENTGAPSCGANCDNDSSAFCHDKVEGGMSDWRLPSFLELAASFDKSDGTPLYFHIENPGDHFWASDTKSSSDSQASRYKLYTGISYGTKTWTNTKVYCVRGGKKSPTKLIINKAPLSLGVNTTPLVSPLIIALVDEDNARVNAKDITITISSTDLGALSGTVTTTTDLNGLAKFNFFKLDTIGSATLTITAVGYSSITTTIIVGEFPNICIVDNAQYGTLQGGCKDKGTGLIWSLPRYGLSWHASVWDSEGTGVGGSGPDANDSGRVNDYDPIKLPHNDPTKASYDDSTTHYCHDLIEGGEEDWRLPTLTELAGIYLGGGGAPNIFSFDLDKKFWSGKTYTNASYSDQAYLYNLSTGSTANQTKINSAGTATICVRDE